ncbi:MAG TPA: GAF domain-containing SpoIIE family protein phosphatase [Thermoanaerobaculia bacterium]|nr:GAF domain-containing SpoIIE family protein phosphatase [Thermoanaerobaculia bacterium]
MEEKRQERAIQGLLELSRDLSSRVDLDALLRVIVEKASVVVDADRTSVFLVDGATGRLTIRIGEGISRTTIELAEGHGIAGSVAKTGEIVNVEDAYLDPRFSPRFDRATGYRTRSMLAAPIIDESGALLGVLQSLNKKTAARFDAEDESLMQAMASHVAVALERGRMTERLVEAERLAQSLETASEIQMRMLPPFSRIASESLPFQIGGCIRPARMIGGDFYDFLITADRRLQFCIGDVSGKGIPAALMMAVVKTLFRALSRVESTPEAITAAVNRQLSRDIDPTMFASAFYGSLALDTGMLEYSNAGHNPPLLLRASGRVETIPSRPGVVLGVVKDFGYALDSILLDPGDTICLYTDGLSEARNADEELFSVERLREVLERNRGEHPDRIVAEMVAAVEGFAGAEPQSDDITAMCIRYGATFDPPPPRP